METRAEYVLVGGFVLALLAGLAVALVWFVQAQFKASAVRYDVYFEGSVSGLAAGSTVRFNGVPVGGVSAIQLDPQHPTRVRVTADIQPDVVIRDDAVAQLQIQGLTGTAYVEITGASGDASPLKALPGQQYPVIASKPSQLEQLFSGIPDLVQKLSTLADQLNDLSGPDNRAAITETIANLRKVSAVAAAHSKDLDAALTDLPRAVEHIESAAARLDQQGLPELQQLLADSRVLVSELSRLAATLDRDPSRLLYGDRTRGYTPQ
jgi:phospholipid/cholesterol/gamma-HCH transport system substrate-binding protein